MNSDEAKGAALGAVIYDLHLLATALLVHRTRHPDVGNWLRHLYYQRLAVEVMLLKSRTLLDLMCPPKRPFPGDICIEAFGLQPVKLDTVMKKFRTFVNKRSTHLTWDRTPEQLKSWQKLQGESIPARAMKVFDFAYDNVVTKAFANGVQLVRARHKNFFDQLQQQYTALKA